MWWVGPSLLLAWLTLAACQEETKSPPCEEKRPEAGVLFNTDHFPLKYASNSNCSYRLEAAPGKRIHLTFYVIDFEQNEQCRYDSITVRDTNGSEIHKLCGENQDNVEVTSTGELLTLQLVSDSVQEGRGFLASWRQVDEAPLSQGSEGEYLLSYPSSLLHASPETLCLELFKDGAAAEIQVELFDTSLDTYLKGSQPELFEREPAAVGSTRISAGSGIACLNLTVPEGTPGDSALLKVTLQIQGLETITKYQSVRLLGKENYPLVQTDKGQYKAKDAVKFRVLILDHALKPSETKVVEEVWVEDPRGRRIQQWLDADLNQGMLQREMLLGEEPELGTWSINFKAGSVKDKETFEVSEYVLPKFEVKIKAPAAVLKDAEEVEWMVCGTYTHGGSVKGLVRANFSSKYQSHGWRRPPPILKSIMSETEVTADEDCASLKLARPQILDLTEKVEYFMLEVEFEEAGTGTVVKAETSSTLKDKAILMDAGSSSRAFILGGFPYTGELVVKNHDNSPVVGEEVEVCVRLFKDIQEIRNSFNRRGIWSMDEDEIVEMGKQMVDIHQASKCHRVVSDATGRVKFHVPLASVPEGVKKLSIKAKAVNRPGNTSTGMVQPEVKLDVTLSNEGNDLSLGLLRKEKKELECDQDFTATVFFSSAAPRTVTLHYNMVSKGVIIKSERMEVEVGGRDAMAELVEGTQELAVQDGQGSAASQVSSANLNLPIDHVVSPKVKLVVFVNEGNSTLTDSHEYKVEACQEHGVSARWSKEKVYPGEDVTLTVNAEAGSLCALSATDKSVDLLGNKNKITGPRTAQLRETIGSRKSSQASFNWKMQNKCPKTFEALKVFEGTGIKIASDLPFLAQCETVIDAVKTGSTEPEVLNSPVPVAFSSDERRKRSIRLRRCVEQLAVEPVVAEGNFEIGAFDAPHQEAFVASNRVSAAAPPLPKEKLVEPSLALRTFFPETWLFSLDLVEPEAGLQRNLTAPDTITTWSAEAVCMNSQVGLGVAEPAALLVSQDFFAELRLPYSVKRGESFPLNVTVFNYIDAELPMVVTIRNQEDELTVVDTVHRTCVRAKDNNVISIPAEAMKLGEVNITVEATISNSVEGCRTVTQGEGFKDALVKPLRVKAEGVPVEKVESDFKCFETGSEKFTMGRLETPGDVVEDSARAWVTLTGDIMAPALENVGNLVRQPTGCGEQNMVGLVPNIFLLQYLEGTNQREPELEEKAKEFMRIGYRRQANYHHGNGAYSIWGDKGDKDGSSWLTAFVVKSFSEAAQYITVEEEVVQRSVDWLMKGQMENGCFPKRGYVHSSYLKGGGSDASLTPFIVTAMLEAASSPQLNIKVDYGRLGEAVECMMKGLNTSDTYASIVASHSASLLANKLATDPRLAAVSVSPETTEATGALLDSLVTSANTSLPGQKFWELVKPASPCRWYWGCGVSSEAVEMTAYMVQALVLRDREAEALEAVKWLGKQRNSRGGFVSTQDTVVALQALSMYSQRVTRVPLDMTVTVDETTASSQLGVFTLDSTNSLLLQTQKVSQLPSELEVETRGSGCAMVQTVLRYNIPEAPATSGFELSAVQEGNGVTVCARYTGSQQETGMVVMEVEMVSGWSARFPEIEALANSVDYEIQRVERGKDDKDTVVLYFDSWPKAELCMTLPLKQEVAISEAKPAVVTVYDYYNTEDKASVLYTLNTLL